MVVLVVLVLAAIVFGVGAVLEGLFWLLIIAVVLLVVAGYVGSKALRRSSR